MITLRDKIRQRDRLVRAIVQSQLLVSVALLMLAASALVLVPESLGEFSFFLGIAIVFLLTVVAVLVPWSAANKGWAILLPVFDIVAIVEIREGAPQLGVGLFLVFPVIWMARNFRLPGAIGGAGLASVLLWLAWSSGGEPLSVSDFGGLVLLPVTLSFIAVTTYATARRSASQRALLRQQAGVTDVAFARARDQKRYLEEILNAVEFGVVAFDKSGKVTLLNDAHRQSLTDFAAPRSALIHPVAYQADRVTTYPPDSHPFARALTGQAFENLTLWVGEPGAHRVAFSVTSRGLTTPEGSPDGGVMVLRNVTTELDAVQARDDLIASVSHELRTPLTSILGYLELALDDDGLDAGTQHMVDVAYRNSQRLLSLVADLLLAASDADTTLPLTFEPCDIGELVELAVDDARAVANSSGVVLRSEVSGAARTNADPLRIRQVIDNLLSNAIKYNTLNGSVNVNVTSVANAIRVSVTDTGVGLSEAERTHLFDRFYRTESARRSRVHGTGLGIGIARDIVRQHGGEIHVSSEPGVGSTFTMTLPSVRELGVLSIGRARNEGEQK